ncbi:MAG TPA: hypothetical protein VFI41_05455 [Gemmatimonadales bacterium]|nr:hypothetical protein [Gemmatimonadales bacterium]
MYESRRPLTDAVADVLATDGFELVTLLALIFFGIPLLFIFSPFILAGWVLHKLRFLGSRPRLATKRLPLWMMVWLLLNIFLLGALASTPELAASFFWPWCLSVVASLFILFRGSQRTQSIPR